MEDNNGEDNELDDEILPISKLANKAWWVLLQPLQKRQKKKAEKRFLLLFKSATHPPPATLFDIDSEMISDRL